MPSGWVSVSGAGGAFNGKFIMGSSAYDPTPQGSATHSHSNLGVATGSPSGTALGSSGSNDDLASTTHTHTITVSFSAPNHEPPYINVIFGYRDVQDTTKPVVNTTFNVSNALVTSVVNYTSNITN